MRTLLRLLTTALTAAALLLIPTIARALHGGAGMSLVDRAPKSESPPQSAPPQDAPGTTPAPTAELSPPPASSRQPNADAPSKKPRPHRKRVPPKPVTTGS